MSKELRVIDQLYEFILWTHNHIERFPRSVKFTIGSRIQDQQLEVLHAGRTLLISTRGHSGSARRIFCHPVLRRCVLENRPLLCRPFFQLPVLAFESQVQ